MMLRPSIFGDNLFDDLFDGFMKPMRALEPNTSLMKTDVKEYDGNFELAIELPGVKKEDVSAELNDGYLTVKACHNTENDEKDDNGKYIRRERFFGSASRSYYVGDAVTEEDIKAKFENGVLKLTVPKIENKPVEEKKYIAIEG